MSILFIFFHPDVVHQERAGDADFFTIKTVLKIKLDEKFILCHLFIKFDENRPNLH